MSDPISTIKIDREFKSIFEHAGIGMGFASLSGKWLRVNPALCAMLGYSEEELLQKTFADITFSEDKSADLLARNRMIAGEIQTYQREKRYVHRDGQPIWVQLNVSILKDEQNNPTSFFSQTQNITERKNAENALSESLASIIELSTLVNQARDAIILLDIDGKVRLWNQGAEKLYGWTSEEAIGRKNTELYVADSEAHDESMRQLRLKEHWEGETPRKTRAGAQLIVQSRATLLKDSNGIAKSILVISTDITEEKNNLASKFRSQRLESIGTLAGGIAHDLNNVLTPMTMAIDLLSTGETDESRLSILETLSSCAKRGASMIRQVLLFARGTEGERAEVQPETIIREIEKIVTDTFLKTVRIEFLISKNLWTVSADSTQLQQVLLNLAVNARDAMPSLGGKLLFQAENVELSEHDFGFSDCKPGPYVRISVEDNGSGMPKKVLDRIFEPFFTTKEIGNGTGLGLSTSLAIVKSHDGFIKVYSEENLGTKFNIYLPAIQSKVPEAVTRSENPAPRGNNEYILVVDDEPAVLKMTAKTLETFGYRVRVASDGFEALAIYKEHQNQIAAVLTDVMMPGMDGISLIRALRELNPKAIIIAASGLASHASHTHANIFLSKPYSVELILKTLHECLTGS